MNSPKSGILAPTKNNHDTGKSLVSIGFPVYNGEGYMRQALDSLISQDYDNLELIISDNASTDATKDICQKYARGSVRVYMKIENSPIMSTGYCAMILGSAPLPLYPEFSWFVVPAPGMGVS